MTGELRTAAGVRDLLGPDARPTICFEWGGWSPALFADWGAPGSTSSPKGPLRPEPRKSFVEHEATITFGHPTTYLLAQQPIRGAHELGDYKSTKRGSSCIQDSRATAAHRDRVPCIQGAVDASAGSAE